MGGFPKIMGDDEPMPEFKRAKPRFPGDMGKYMDMPLEDVGKPDEIQRQGLGPAEPGPTGRMPSLIRMPDPVIQRIGASEDSFQEAMRGLKGGYSKLEETGRQYQEARGKIEPQGPYGPPSPGAVPMKKWTVKMKDGTVYTGVQAPTREEAVRKMTEGPQGPLGTPSQTPQQAPGAPQAPSLTDTAGQGVMSALGARTPLQGESVKDMPGPLAAIGSNLAKNWPDIAAMVATFPVGGGKVLGPLARTATAGGVQTGGRMLQGESLEEAAPKGIAQMIGQGLGEGVGQLARFGFNAQSANRIGKQQEAAKGAYEAAVGTRGEKIAHDKAMTGALNQTETQGFEQASRAHADQGAAKIAEDLADKVPALKGIEKSGKGLYDAIYGSGKDKVSAAFDVALKDVATKGRGQMVNLPSEVAERLGVTAAADPLAGVSPAVVEALRKAGRLPAGAGGTPGVSQIDAAQLAEKMTGLWKKDPQAYRAAARALDEAGIGDPAARAAYKAYSGISSFIDKAKGIDANGTLNPANILKALADLKKVEEMRRRGLGSGTEGVVQQAARGGPLKPTPREIPNAPPEIPKPGPGPEIKTSQIPWYVRGGAGAAAGAALGGGGHWGPGGILGGALGHALIPSEVVTKAPLSPLVEKFLRALPGAFGPLGRQTLTSTE